VDNAAQSQVKLYMPDTGTEVRVAHLLIFCYLLLLHVGMDLVVFWWLLPFFERIPSACNKEGNEGTAERAHFGGAKFCWNAFVERILKPILQCYHRMTFAQPSVGRSSLDLERSSGTTQGMAHAARQLLGPCTLAPPRARGYAPAHAAFVWHALLPPRTSCFQRRSESTKTSDSSWALGCS